MAYLAASVRKSSECFLSSLFPGRLCVALVWELSWKIWELPVLSSALRVFLHGELLLGRDRTPPPLYQSILKSRLLLDLALGLSRIGFRGEKSMFWQWGVDVQTLWKAPNKCQYHIMGTDPLLHLSILLFGFFFLWYNALLSFLLFTLLFATACSCCAQCAALFFLFRVCVAVFAFVTVVALQSQQRHFKPCLLFSWLFFFFLLVLQYVVLIILL